MRSKTGKFIPWTEAEISLVSQWNGRWIDLVPLLPDRTVDAIFSKTSKLGIHHLIKWTDAEKELIRQYYPTGGWKAVARAGVNRTEGAIHRQAIQLGCQFDGKCNDHIRTVIRRYYEDGLPSPAKRAAHELDINVGRIYNYAANMGLYTRGHKTSKWSEFEVALLEKNVYKSAITISKLFNRVGYKRTAAAIEMKRRSLCFSRKQSDYMTPAEVGNLLGGFTTSSVIKWINNGQLKAIRRGYERDSDHWLIHEKNLRIFVLENPEILRRYWARIDPLWLIGGLLNTTADGSAVSLKTEEAA